jgi:hypothetical protein
MTIWALIADIEWPKGLSSTSIRNGKQYLAFIFIEIDESGRRPSPAGFKLILTNSDLIIPDRGINVRYETIYATDKDAAFASCTRYDQLKNKGHTTWDHIQGCADVSTISLSDYAGLFEKANVEAEITKPTQATGYLTCSKCGLINNYEFPQADWVCPSCKQFKDWATENETP